MSLDLDDSTGFEEPTTDSPEVTVAKEQNALAITEDMDRVKNSLNEFDRVSAGLADLEQRYPKDAIYPVETTKGMKDAIEHRAAYRDPRVMVEKARKMAKAPLLALGKNIDARAKWITEQLTAGEEPVDQQIKAEEARKESERQARAAAEAARVLKIQEALAEIGQNVLIACGKTSVEVRALSEQMHATLPDPDVFQEMLDQAKAAWASGIEKLETALKAKLYDEAEAARIAAEQAAEEQRRKDEAARLEAQRIENERAAEEQRKAAEAMAEERRQFEAEKAAMQAEKDRLAKLEADRQARVAARFDRYEELLAFNGTEAADEINTTIARLTSNAPSEDTYGDRVEEAQSKHAQVLAHLHALLPAAIEREEAVRLAQLATEAAAATTPAAAPAVIPVAAPVSQVRQPDPAPAPAEEQPTLTLGTINARLGFTVTAEFLTGLGFTPVQVKAARLFRESQFGAICSAIADHTLKVAAVKSLEKAA
jgi:DNA repair exonuclease SbcCD ATPase subunit